MTHDPWPMTLSQPLFALLDLLLVFAAVGAFAWWQLRDVARAQRLQREVAKAQKVSRDDAADIL